MKFLLLFLSLFLLCDGVSTKKKSARLTEVRGDFSCTIGKKEEGDVGGRSGRFRHEFEPREGTLSHIYKWGRMTKWAMLNYLWLPVGVRTPTIAPHAYLLHSIKNGNEYKTEGETRKKSFCLLFRAHFGVYKCERQDDVIKQWDDLLWDQFNLITPSPSLIPRAGSIWTAKQRVKHDLNLKREENSTSEMELASFERWDELGDLRLTNELPKEREGEGEGTETKWKGTRS